MAGWYVALVLYLLPIIDGLAHMEEDLDECKAWMRESGYWFPALAPMIVVLSLIPWPLLYVVSIFNGPK